MSHAPPQDCRSRGDCGGVLTCDASEPTATASRLPQSRRLRPMLIVYDTNRYSPPQDCRSRGDCGVRVDGMAESGQLPASRLPQSRRLRLVLRMSCNFAAKSASRLPQSRRLRPPVAEVSFVICVAASRLPQSRRLRHARRALQVRNQVPPQDCRSRGDCGELIFSSSVCSLSCRLKIAAVAATAAVSVRRIAADGSHPPQDCRSRGDCG